MPEPKQQRAFLCHSDDLINPILFLSRRSHRLGGGVLGATGALGGAVAEAVAELAGDELQ